MEQLRNIKGGLSMVDMGTNQHFVVGVEVRVHSGNARKGKTTYFPLVTIRTKGTDDATVEYIAVLKVINDIPMSRKQVHKLAANIFLQGKINANLWHVV